MLQLLLVVCAVPLTAAATADVCTRWNTCGSCVNHNVANTTGGHDDSCKWCEGTSTCTSPSHTPATGCAPAQCIRSPDGGEDSNCTHTAGDPGVKCEGWEPPPPPPPISKKIWDDSKCSCVDFCDYKCANAVEHADTSLHNVTLYRLTPYNAPGLDNMNTASPGGDVDFILSRKTIAVDCEQDPKGERCFLAHANVYGRFTVTVDGRWGPYQFCNPINTPTGPDVSHFTCCTTFDHDDPGICLPAGPAADLRGFTPYPVACNCPRANVTVGNVDHGEMEKWAGWANASHKSWSTTLGGRWYSTPIEGKCTGSETPGTGKRGECTWRTAAVVYKNTSCVDAQLDAAVEAHGKSCFALCPDRLDPAYFSCYIGCYFSAIGGNATAPGGALSPMSKAQMTDPWIKAIASADEEEGGCPACHGEPPYHLGSCPWTAR